jgi:Ala-tRNA(Pro) deacylase
MPATQLTEFLDTNHIKYSVIGHSAAFTAQGIAALAHIPGKELAKTVIVKVDDKMAMAVLPASSKIDLDLLKQATRAEKVELAAEGQFRSLFPDCETGAMPPLGNLYGVTVLVDRALTKDEEIAFNAGSHRELIRMSYRDFERLVRPRVADFSKRG